MRIVSVAERTVPIASTISNAWIDFREMTCSAVAITAEGHPSGRRITGFGFNSNGRYGQPGLLRERFIPRLLAAAEDDITDPSTGLVDPVRTHDVLLGNEKPGGHGERSVAVGVLDMALWDLAAKGAGVPLARLLAERSGSGVATSIRVYAAGGYYDGAKGLDGLRTELQGYIDSGYDAVKIKVGGSSLEEDLRRIDVAIGVTGAPSRVAVDANGRFSVSAAEAFGRAIEGFGLMWYEEPVDPLDYAGHAALALGYGGALATGENLFSIQDVRNLLRHGGLRPGTDILQMDPVLSYGLTEYLGMLSLVDAAGFPRSACIPHGGHLLNLHAAAGLGLSAIEAYPAVFRPFGGLGDDNPVQAGRVRVGDAPGLGLERDTALMAVLRTVA